MDWTQVLAIVLPVMFAIIIGIFYNNRRLDDMNRRFDDVNRRIDDLRTDFSDLKLEIREMRNMLVELLKKETVM